MTSTIAGSLVFLTLCAGCASAADPATQPDKPTFSECPEVEMLRDRAGWAPAPRGKYRAQQVPGAVLIFAEGENPTAGCEMTIAMNPTRIFPPQFTLYVKRPEMAAQVITPYALCVKWKVDHRQHRVGQIVLFDADGRVEVPVELVLD